MSDKVLSVFKISKPIIGMLHLNGASDAKIHELAKFEIEVLYKNGIDAILAENYFGTAKDVEWALSYLRDNYSEKIYGVNILGGTEIAFKLAAEFNAAFIQVDSVCGHLAHDDDLKFAEDLNALRNSSNAFLLGGVRFKYKPVNSGRALDEDLTLGKGRCDAVVVTGSGTGIGTKLEKIREFKKFLQDFPLFVGAGMTDETCREQLAIADGAIVGSYFKHGGRDDEPISPERVKRFMNIVNSFRLA